MRGRASVAGAAGLLILFSAALILILALALKGFPLTFLSFALCLFPLDALALGGFLPGMTLSLFPLTFLSFALCLLPLHALALGGFVLGTAPELHGLALRLIPVCRFLLGPALMFRCGALVLDAGGFFP